MAYHIEEKRLLFRNLPFVPDVYDVIYMEGAHDELVDKCIRDNIDAVREKVSGGFVDKFRFVYLPDVYGGMEEATKYNAPFCNDHIEGFGSDALLRYLDNPADGMSLEPCMLCYDGDDDEGRAVFRGFSFTIDGAADFMPMLEELCDSLGLNTVFYSSLEEVPLPDDTDKSSGSVEEKKIEPPENLASASIDFSCIKDVTQWDPIVSHKIWEENEVRLLMDEVKEKVANLRQRGVSEWALRQLIAPERRLSRLVVTSDMTLLLPDYGNMEIRLEPIHMAVYLFFLRHPEGVAFKMLIDYCDELTQLYITVRRKRGERMRNLAAKCRESVERMVSPLSNSINEKCSRIRAAFLLKFAEYLACDYFITGERAEPKRILLPRELVEWQVKI